MRDSNEPVAHRAVANASASTAVCRNCATALVNQEYYCPECDTPHFPNLKGSLLSPSIKFLAFFFVIAGPVAAYTLWEVLQRISFKV
ncbi:MAG: hypothetical protein K2Y05_03220 [Hyphomicrobiaceae bacterium]|nr:hypothetical protein [Hyphomicrobiaceae bacterium]